MITDFDAIAQYNTPSSELKRAHEERFTDPRDATKEAEIPGMNQERAGGCPVEVYANGRWQIARTRDRASSVHELKRSQPRGDFMMSGALHPGQKDTAVQNTDFSSSTHPGQIVSRLHDPREHHSSIDARFDDQMMRPPDKNMHLKSPYTGHDLPADQQQPLLAIPRSSAMRQPLGQALADGSLRQRLSGAQAVTDMIGADHELAGNRPIPSRHDGLPTRAVINPTSSPFLYNAHSQRHLLQLPMGNPPIPRSRSGRVALYPNHSRMDLDRTPPMGQSLNSLSFVQEPYTSMNKPIYTLPTTRASFSRAAPNWSAEPRTDPSQGRSYTQNEDVSGISLVAPTFRRPQQPGSRISNVDIGGLKGVKGSSVSVPPLERQFGMSAFDSRFPYQQQRGLNTAGGRRSVRR